MKLQPSNLASMSNVINVFIDNLLLLEQGRVSVEDVSAWCQRKILVRLLTDLFVTTILFVIAEYISLRIRRTQARPSAGGE